jgi:hypothetical protein
MNERSLRTRDGRVLGACRAPVGRRAKSLSGTNEKESFKIGSFNPRESTANSPIVFGLR